MTNYDPETHVMDLQADLRKLEGKLNQVSQELYAAELTVKRLRAVIQEVVDDDESREDGTGWGPDVTCLLKLKAALREPSTDPADSEG